MTSVVYEVLRKDRTERGVRLAIKFTLESDLLKGVSFVKEYYFDFEAFKTEKDILKFIKEKAIQWAKAHLLYNKIKEGDKGIITLD